MTCCAKIACSDAWNFLEESAWYEGDSKHRWHNLVKQKAKETENVRMYAHKILNQAALSVIFVRHTHEPHELIRARCVHEIVRVWNHNNASAAFSVNSCSSCVSDLNWLPNFWARVRGTRQAPSITGTALWNKTGKTMRRQLASHIRKISKQATSSVTVMRNPQEMCKLIPIRCVHAIMDAWNLNNVRWNSCLWNQDISKLQSQLAAIVFPCVEQCMRQFLFVLFRRLRLDSIADWAYGQEVHGTKQIPSITGAALWNKAQKTMRKQPGSHIHKISNQASSSVIAMRHAQKTHGPSRPRRVQ